MATHTPKGANDSGNADNIMSSSERNTDALYFNNFVHENNDYSNSRMVQQGTFNNTGNCFTPPMNQSNSYMTHNDNDISIGSMYLQPKPMIRPPTFEGDGMYLSQTQTQQQTPHLEQDVGMLHRMKGTVSETGREYMGGAAAAAYNAMRQDYLDELQKEAQGERNESLTQTSAFEFVPQSSTQLGTTNPNPNEHYELLKQHRMNLIEEIQETALMLRMYEQQRQQKLEQQLRQQKLEQQQQPQKQHESFFGRQAFPGQATYGEVESSSIEFVRQRQDSTQLETEEQQRMLDNSMRHPQRSDINFSNKNKIPTNDFPAIDSMTADPSSNNFGNEKTQNVIPNHTSSPGPTRGEIGTLNADENPNQKNSKRPMNAKDQDTASKRRQKI